MKREAQTLRDVVNSHPLLCALNPVLVLAIGPTEALVLDHINRLLKKAGNEVVVDGRPWVTVSMNEVAAATGLTHSTTRRAVWDLESRGLLVNRRNSPGEAAMYSIPYENPWNTPGQNDPGRQVKMTRGSGQNDPGGQVKLTRGSGHNDPGQPAPKSGVSCGKDTENGILAQSLQLKEEKKEEKTKSVFSLRENPRPGGGASSLHPHRSGHVGVGGAGMESGNGFHTTEKSEQEKVEYLKRRGEVVREKMTKRASATYAIEFWKITASLADPDAHISLTKQEVGMMKSLIKWIDGSGYGACAFISFAIENWGELRKRLTWGDSKKSRLGEHPSFKEVFFVKEDIVRLMRRGLALPSAAKSKDSSTVEYTSAEQVPEDHPDRKRIIAMIEVNGKAVARRI